MAPGGLVSDPIDAISLGMALMFGTAGLPHILMRFFTVSDAKEARKSVFYATGFIGYFYILTFIIGFGAIVLVLNVPEFMAADGKGILGGTNMAAIHLSKAVGGDLFLGFISAVAFATILAVVSGLTLSGASAVSHDLYASVFRQGHANEAEEIRVSKITTLFLGVIAIVLGIAFENQNIAFMVGLAFAIAASANFPVLFIVDVLEGSDHPWRLPRWLHRSDHCLGSGGPRPADLEERPRSPGCDLPVLQPGDLLHAARVLLLLAVLQDGQLSGCREGAGSLRSAVCPVADWYWCRRCFRALTGP